MLARQAMAIDDLSGGRFVLGIGAGWNQREHTMFGYPLGEIPERMDRLTEATEVITRLIRSDTPQTFDGSSTICTRRRCCRTRNAIRR